MSRARPGRPPEVDEALDRRVVRRALVAGGTVTGIIGGGGAVAVLAIGGSAGLAFAAVIAGLTFGAVVSSGWLLLSIFLDVLAGWWPGRRRRRWAIGITVLTFLCPALLLAALTAASTAP